MRPQVHINDLRKAIKPLENEIQESEINEEIIQAAEILMKYEGYIERERLMAEKMHRLESIKITNLNYEAIQSLSTEGRQKLIKIQPETIGQASRISGVTPSDISVLLVFIGR